MKIKILHVLHGLHNGGAEIFVMNVYRVLDQEKIQFDFLLRSANNSESMVEEIHKLGGKIFIMPEFPKKARQHKYEMKKFFREHAEEYEGVHIHANSMLYMEPLKLAKAYQINKIILHSHNINTTGKLAAAIHKYNRKKIYKYANYYLACSTEAGRWMFENHSFQVIRNGIDGSLYQYNEENRMKIRKELNLEDSFVVGHVGRFHEQKNHGFIIKIFCKVMEGKENARLLLVGSGKEAGRIERELKALGIENKVVVLNDRRDIYQLLSAMDFFLFPSLYEGLSIALLEAEMVNLPCLISNTISDETLISNKVKVMDLSEPAAKWADYILNYQPADRNQPDACLKKNKKLFDIHLTAKALEHIYTKDRGAAL